MHSNSAGCRLIFEKILEFLYSSDKYNIKEKYSTISKHIDDLMLEYENLYSNSNIADESTIFVRCINLVFVREQISFDIDSIDKILKSTIKVNHDNVKKNIENIDPEIRKYLSRNSLENSRKFTENYQNKPIPEDIKQSIRNMVNAAIVIGDIDFETLPEHIKIKIRNNSIKNGTSNLPENLGNIIFGVDSSDDEDCLTFINKYRDYIPQLYQDNVHIYDIILWWSQADYHRHTFYFYQEVSLTNYILSKNRIKIDILNMSQQLKTFKSNNPKSYEEGIKEYHYCFPTYNAYEFKQEYILKDFSNEEDRPLPFELYRRVQKYIQRNGGDEKVYQIALEANCKSINAYIRKIIKDSGNLI